MLQSDVVKNHLYQQLRTQQSSSVRSWEGAGYRQITTVSESVRFNRRSQTRSIAWTRLQSYRKHILWAQVAWQNPLATSVNVLWCNASNSLLSGGGDGARHPYLHIFEVFLCSSPTRPGEMRGSLFGCMVTHWAESAGRRGRLEDQKISGWIHITMSETPWGKKKLPENKPCYHSVNKYRLWQRSHRHGCCGSLCQQANVTNAVKGLEKVRQNHLTLIWKWVWRQAGLKVKHAGKVSGSCCAPCRCSSLNSLWSVT